MVRLTGGIDAPGSLPGKVRLTLDPKYNTVRCSKATYASLSLIVYSKFPFDV